MPCKGKKKRTYITTKQQHKKAHTLWLEKTWAKKGRKWDLRGKKK